jgi:hypothetical protein
MDTFGIFFEYKVGEDGGRKDICVVQNAIDSLGLIYGIQKSKIGKVKVKNNYKKNTGFLFISTYLDI